ncbi:unnamed protein product [Arctogadus glacialis]
MVDRGRADGCKPGGWLVRPRQGGPRQGGWLQAGWTAGVRFTVAALPRRFLPLIRTCEPHTELRVYKRRALSPVVRPAELRHDGRADTWRCRSICHALVTPQGQVKEHHRRDANFVETSREPQRESVPLRAEATADPRTDREQRRRYTVPLAQPHTDTRNKKRAEHDVVSHRTVCEEIPDRQSSTRLHRHRQACSVRAARDGTAARST